MAYHDERFERIHTGDGTIRYAITPDYAAYLDRLQSTWSADEETIAGWFASGMVGRLVRRDGELMVDTSDPNANGELVIFEEGG